MVHRRRKARRRLLGSAVIAALALAYGWLIEPRMIELTTYQITVPNLPARLDGLRVVQLGDIHRRATVPDDIIRRAVSAANSAHADLAVLSGDYVGYSTSDIEASVSALSGVRAKHGSVAVLGNHDYATDASAVSASLRRHGIRLLRNSSAEAAPGLCIVGIDDEWFGKPDPGEAFAGIGPRNCYITVAHNPLTAERLRGRRGLLMSGHTHGGQVALPPVHIDGIPGLIRWGYLRGWHRVGGMRVYVNRGVGMGSIPLRIGCRPEVTLYILRSPGKGPR